MNCGTLCNVTNWGLRLGLTSDMRLYDNCTMTLGIVDFWVLSVFYNLQVTQTKDVIELDSRRLHHHSLSFVAP